ncbi:aminotransferase class I/II-fold pyridoxal phosphate-dependent enzyme [Nocardioides convexus]|uniref:aminotransferase class I/II-fold pyridoxal phosphate-dependent enzyme n=1 Tax=Nocardioides convexus TaxID=2712224 RepID=UPI0031010AA2
MASLPSFLGLGADDLIGYPALAYPTYEVGAALVGAKAVATDALTAFGPETPALLWVNSPSNPSGRILPKEHLKKVVDWCRERGVLLVSDECYLDCVWEGEAHSVLHPDICGGSAEGILVVHSLSKRSNLAGYRCAFVAGDRAVIAGSLAVRKNLGLLMPGPTQHAMAAALGDETHVAEQHERYRARRTRLRGALEAAGYTIDHSEASLYLWTTKGPDGPDSWRLVAESRREGDPRRAGCVLRHRRRAARADRAHGDRRADRRRRRPPHRLTGSRGQRNTSMWTWSRCSRIARSPGESGGS